MTRGIPAKGIPLVLVRCDYTMLSVQITGGLDLHPVGVAGIVSQRYILHFDDLHSLTHGAGLAVIFPAWMRYVWREHPERFLEFSAQALGIEPIDSDADELDVEVTPEQAIEYAVEATIDELQDFFVSLGMPRALSEFGVTEDDIEKMIPGLKINRGELFGSFRKLTLDNARKIYRSAL